MTVENKFQKWAVGFSGCDGGDIGSSHAPSIWVCGIEWGGGHNADSLTEHIQQQVSTAPLGYEDPAENLAYIFNRKTMQILTAMEGGLVQAYENIARERRPFVKGEKGYFKLNLFPIAFKDTSPQRWQSEFVDITGFPSKEAYLAWCRSARFDAMRSWVSTSKPKTIICFGKTYLKDFSAAFTNGNSEFVTENILGRSLSWSRTVDDVLVVVCPFPVGRYGLNSHVLVQGFGNRIRSLMNDKLL
jgi:hypothetical protein